MESSHFESLTKPNKIISIGEAAERRKRKEVSETEAESARNYIISEKGKMLPLGQKSDTAFNVDENLRFINPEIINNQELSLAYKALNLASMNDLEIINFYEKDFFPYYEDVRDHIFYKQNKDSNFNKKMDHRYSIKEFVLGKINGEVLKRVANDDKVMEKFSDELPKDNLKEEVEEYLRMKKAA